jgi:hypothetical protein
VRIPALNSGQYVRVIGVRSGEYLIDVGSTVKTFKDVPPHLSSPYREEIPPSPPASLPVIGPPDSGSLMLFTDQQIPLCAERKVAVLVCLPAALVIYALQLASFTNLSATMVLFLTPLSWLMTLLAFRSPDRWYQTLCLEEQQSLDGT